MKIHKEFPWELDLDKIYALTLGEDFNFEGDCWFFEFLINLKYLNISNLDLDATSEVFKLTQLETFILDESGYDMEEFLQENFPNLKCFHLGIDTSDVRERPDFCSYVPQIKELGLYINSETMEIRPWTSGNFDYHREEYDLPSDLGSLAQLEKLVVVFNAAPSDYEELYFYDVFKKIHALKNLQQLTTISIRNNAAAEYNADILNDSKAINNYLPNVSVSVFDKEGNKL